MSEIDHKDVLALTRRIKKSHPGAFSEFHRLNRAQNRIQALEDELTALRIEVKDAQRAWDNVGKE
jgi:septation ring formation regulator EzrA